MWRISGPRPRDLEKAPPRLERFFDVFLNRKRARFLISRSVEADFSPEEETVELWKTHSLLLEDFSRAISQDDQSPNRVVLGRTLLDLKVELAKRMLKNCQFCARRCGVDRANGEFGSCRGGSDFTVSSAFAHMGEEPELVPSGTIFTCSCNMRCLHCQNWHISQNYEEGDPYTPVKMARLVDRLRRGGCRNANLVGGEPTIWIHDWLETFTSVETNTPIVWNSNAYYSEETAQLLSGFIDIYLLDFKYGNDTCAERISSSPNYWENCTRNHVDSFRDGEVIVRVLVLPEHLDCCLSPTLNWLSSNLAGDVRVNLLWQFRPEWRAKEIPELGRRLTSAEKTRTLEIARRSGLTNLIT